MSVRTLRWVLWVVAVSTLPVPYFALASERAPALRATFLAGLFAAIWLIEGGRQAATAAGLASVQALAWLALLFLAAWLLARLLERWIEPRLRTRILVLLCAGMLAASLRPIYQTPLSSTRPQSSWSGIFD